MLAMPGHTARRALRRNESNEKNRSYLLRRRPRDLDERVEFAKQCRAIENHPVLSDGNGLHPPASALLILLFRLLAFTQVTQSHPQLRPGLFHGMLLSSTISPNCPPWM